MDFFTSKPKDEPEAGRVERFAAASLRKQAEQKTRNKIEEKRRRHEARKEMDEARQRFADLEEYAWMQHNHASRSFDNTLTVLRRQAIKQKQRDKTDGQRTSRLSRKRQLNTRAKDRAKTDDKDEGDPMR